jgi:hypothetical protein
MPNQTIEEAALKLSEHDRAQLAHRLLLSLETQSEAEIAAQWRNIAKQRAAEIDSDSVVVVFAEAVSKAARSLIR